MVNETSLIHTFPRIVHLGSYLRQSDAEHPPNVVFLMIVEEEVSGLPLRSRANTPEFFFKARYELPPGTVLYDMQISLPFLRLSRGPPRPSRILKTLAGIVPFRPRSRGAFIFLRPGLFLAVRPPYPVAFVA